MITRVKKTKEADTLWDIAQFIRYVSIKEVYKIFPNDEYISDIVSDYQKEVNRNGLNVYEDELIWTRLMVHIDNYRLHILSLYIKNYSLTPPF